MQIQYYISLYILRCPDILVDIFKRGSSSITHMCVYLSGSQKSLKIAGCWNKTLIKSLYSGELQLDSVQYYPHIFQYDIGQIWLILPDIVRYSMMLKGEFWYFSILTFKKNVQKLMMMPLIIFKYFVLMFVKSSCFYITVLGAKAPLELAHVKNR